MTVSIIAAVAENNVIGKDNRIIWHMPKDLKFFKQTTSGHHVLMGRKNYLSIPDKYRPLPDRTNIIVTHQMEYVAPDCHVVHSIEEGVEFARSHAENEVFIIGGGDIYEQSIEIADKLYITWLHKNYEGDVRFPNFERDNWSVIEETRYEQDEDHECSFTITIYEKTSTD